MRHALCAVFAFFALSSCGDDPAPAASPSVAPLASLSYTEVALDAYDVLPIVASPNTLGLFVYDPNGTIAEIFPVPPMRALKESDLLFLHLSDEAGLYPIGEMGHDDDLGLEDTWVCKGTTAPLCTASVGFVGGDPNELVLNVTGYGRYAFPRKALP